MRSARLLVVLLPALLLPALVASGGGRAAGPAASTPTPPYRVYLPLVLRCHPLSPDCAPPGVSIWAVGLYSLGPVSYIVGIAQNNGAVPIEDLRIIGVLTTPAGTREAVAWVPTARLRPPVAPVEGEGDRTCFRIASYDPILSYTLALTYRVSAAAYPTLAAAVVATGDLYGYPTATVEIRNVGPSPAAGVGAAVWGWEAPGRVGSCDAVGGHLSLPPGASARLDLILSRPYTPTAFEAHAFSDPIP